MSTEFVTTDFFSVEPLFGITKGAGTEANDKVYTGSRHPVVITLQLDTSLPDLDTLKDWSVVTSTDKTKFPTDSGETVTAITLNKTQGTAELTWFANTPQNNVYYQVKTTSLPLTQYPRQLSAVSTFPIDIVSATPSGPTPCGGTPSTFKMCSVIMVDSQGKSNNFKAGETVTLEFQHDATFSGTATWTYSVSGGSTVLITTTAGPTTPAAGVVAYTWTIPDSFFANAFVVTVTSEGESAISPTYSVTSSFTWNAPNTGHSVLVAKTQSELPDAPMVHWVTTTVTFNTPVATDFSDWSVSLGSPTGTFTTLTDRIYSASLVPGSTTQRALVWYLQPDDFKSSGMDAFVRFTAQNSTHTETLTMTSSETVAFTLTDFAPVTAPLTLGTQGCDVVALCNTVTLYGVCPGQKMQFHFVKDPTQGPLAGWIVQFEATTPNDLNPCCVCLVQGTAADTLYSALPLLYRQGNVGSLTLIDQGSNLWNIYGTLAPYATQCAAWHQISPNNPISQVATAGSTPLCASTATLNTQFLWPVDVF